jgi:hypothetical protein
MAGQHDRVETLVIGHHAGAAEALDGACSAAEPVEAIDGSTRPDELDHLSRILGEIACDSPLDQFGQASPGKSNNWTS